MVLENSRIKSSKLWFQYESKNLDVSKVCFAKKLDIPNTQEESRKN